jgi:hypothetical protein
MGFCKESFIRHPPVPEKSNYLSAACIISVSEIRNLSLSSFAWSRSAEDVYPRADLSCSFAELLDCAAFRADIRKLMIKIKTTTAVIIPIILPVGDFFNLFPQFGQDFAVSLISLLHSGHFINGIQPP